MKHSIIGAVFDDEMVISASLHGPRFIERYIIHLPCFSMCCAYVLAFDLRQNGSRQWVGSRLLAQPQDCSSSVAWPRLNWSPTFHRVPKQTGPAYLVACPPQCVNSEDLCISRAAGSAISKSSLCGCCAFPVLLLPLTGDQAATAACVAEPDLFDDELASRACNVLPLRIALSSWSTFSMDSAACPPRRNRTELPRVVPSATAF